MSTPWFRGLRYHDRSHRGKLERRRHFLVEPLEGRQMLSTFTVTNSNDSGTGSLRQALLSSNAIKGPNDVSFDIPGGGVQTINLLSALPALTQPVTIDGTTEPGYKAPVIVLNGSRAGATAIGLSLTSTAAGSTIKGLAVDDFGAGGVLITGGSKDTITADYIGVTATGAMAAGNGGYGVHLTGQATGAIVSNDVISANSGPGIELSDTSDSVVEGDDIGTDATGTTATSTFDSAPVYFGNQGAGVELDSLSTGNTIGGATAAALDVISGNNGNGVTILGASRNVVEGDHIGTDITGRVRLGNADGVLISNSGTTQATTNNTIGGTTAGARDVIAGNFQNGVVIQGASSNLVEGDYIGTDATGMEDVGGSMGNLIGLVVDSGATSNTIGGLSSGAADVISNNDGDGVEIQGSSSNVVEGDLIGVSASGKVALGNDGDGVQVLDAGTTQASHNTVGGTTAGARDVISGNASDNVEIDGADDNLVAGDYLGTDASGEVNLAPSIDDGAFQNHVGVLIAGGATGNTIGGTTSAARDVISGQSQWGVYIENAGSSSNVVEGDYIGTDATGGVALANGNVGVAIVSGANLNTIGGTAAGAGNVISGNAETGVEILGSSNILVAGNRIGTNAAGTVSLPNLTGGVSVENGSQVTIGGAAAGAGNVISGNDQTGVAIFDSSNSLVEGNLIGTNAAGTAALPNAADGLDVSSYDATIGGTAAGAGNVISGNGMVGINLGADDSGDVLVEGNKIGTDVTGNLALGNGYSGVVIDGASDNTIGGTVDAARNVISANSGDGVQIDYAGATYNVVEGNDIGTNVTGTHALGNGRDGVYLWAGASWNVVGGQSASAGNIIAGNAVNGVIIDDASAHNTVQYDHIGTDVTGTVALANRQDGVVIQAGSTLNFVMNDVISGNGGDGVLITGTGTANNVLTADLIGVNAAGTAILTQAGELYSNDGDGVEIAAGATGTWVGLCVIGGNLVGVEIDTAASGSSIYDNHIGTDVTGTLNLGNLEVGVYLSQVTGNLVEENDIEHSGAYGILAFFADQNTLENNLFSGNVDGNEIFYD